jgi:hypothetical protein
MFMPHSTIVLGPMADKVSFGLELVERRRAEAMSATHLCRRHSSFMFFDHPDNLGLGKTTLSHLFAPSKVEQTLH